jgi:hypothetical protein
MTYNILGVENTDDIIKTVLIYRHPCEKLACQHIQYGFNIGIYRQGFNVQPVRTNIPRCQLVNVNDILNHTLFGFGYVTMFAA